MEEGKAGRGEEKKKNKINGRAGGEEAAGRGATAEGGKQIDRKKEQSK